MGALGKIGEGVVRYWPPRQSFLLLGVLTSVPILVKIDHEMRLWECSQTDTQTDADANRFHNLSHAICYGYSYEADNNNVYIADDLLQYASQPVTADRQTYYSKVLIALHATRTFSHVHCVQWTQSVVKPAVKCRR